MEAIKWTYGSMPELYLSTWAVGKLLNMICENLNLGLELFFNVDVVPESRSNQSEELVCLGAVVVC